MYVTALMEKQRDRAARNSFIEAEQREGLEPCIPKAPGQKQVAWIKQTNQQINSKINKMNTK